MNTKRSHLLSYALVTSIILLLMGFLAVGVRAFESAGVSNFVFFAAVGLFVLTPVFYFVGRPAGRAARGQKTFEQPRADRFIEDRRKPALLGQEKTAIAIERRGKHRSTALTARAE